MSFWTEDDTERLNMNLAFADYVNAGEAELLRIRALLHYFFTQVDPDDVVAILRRMRRIMASEKAWAEWVEEAREIIQISRDANPDYEEERQAWLAWMKQADE